MPLGNMTTEAPSTSVVSPSTGRTLPYSNMARAEMYEYSAFRQGMRYPTRTRIFASTRRNIPTSNMTVVEVNEYKAWMIGKAAVEPEPPPKPPPLTFYFVSPSTQRRLPLSNMTPQEMREHTAWGIGRKGPTATRFLSTYARDYTRRYLPTNNMTQNETYEYTAWRIGQGKEYVYTRDAALELGIRKGLAVPPTLYTDQPNVPKAFEVNVAIITEVANRYLTMRTGSTIAVE